MSKLFGSMMTLGGGLLALLLFLAIAPETQADEVDEAEVLILETLEVEAEEEIEPSTLDLEQSFKEPFTREKIFFKKIEQESIPDVKAALKEMPNVTVRESGAYTKFIEIRGLSGDRIISIIDGVRLSNQGLTHVGGGEINLIDISTVDSIEVVKGSPSVIYDPGATGGVILVETKEIAEEDHLRLKYTFGYDGGFEKTKHSVRFSGAKKGFGAALSYSQSDANDYRVKNQAKLDQIILNTNLGGLEGSRLGTPFEIKDLGFEDESTTLKLAYRLNAGHKLSVQYSDYEAEDISFTHGATDSLVFHIDALSREMHQARYEVQHLGILQDISLAFADQEQVRQVRFDTTLLESQNLSVSGVIPIKNTKLMIGGELVDDQARTQVFAEQDYWAGYLSAEHPQGDFTLLVGIRANQWREEAKLLPDRDASIADDLVSVEGQFNPETGEFEDLERTAFTYAAGIVYSLNESSNISLNYSKTDRFPSLFERFAFDGTFVGGGLGLKAEEADNFEAAWKFYDGLFFASVSIFYSDFDEFISIKEERRQSGAQQADLIDCIRQGRCDPLNGEFDGRENDFFDIRFPFFNIKRVVNRGFEVSLKRIREEDYEAGLNFGLSDFDVRSVHLPSEKDLVFANTHPLEFSFYYKRYFSAWTARPWARIRGRYVTNTPSVDQEEGFSAFFVADFFAGLKYDLLGYSNMAFNFGIRNLTDKVYHEPFSALDGLKRTFFLNVSFEIG